jgi:hypothetical protein
VIAKPSIPVKTPSPAARILRAKIVRALSAPERVVFLDIETTGLSRHYHRLTLIGLTRAGTHRAWIVGDEPSELDAALAGAETLVTFNGSGFDVPFLRKALPDLQLPEFHIDLRYAAKHVGLTGGQKAIEREIGFRNRDEPDLDGAAAVVLWYQYLSGDHAALRRLIEYNRADVAGMAHLLDHIIRELKITDGLLFSSEPFYSTKLISLGWADSKIPTPAPDTRGFSRRDYDSLFGGTRAEGATIVGVDLTGSETRPTGWAVMRGRAVASAMLRTDDEIFEATLQQQPTLVSIDSPLTVVVSASSRSAPAASRT